MTYSKAIDNNFIFSICASWVILIINLGHDGVQFITIKYDLFEGDW